MNLKVYLFALAIVSLVSCTGSEDDDGFLDVSDAPNVNITLLAGSTQGDADGVGAAAKFAYPTSICADALGNIYVADSQNHKIKKIATNGTVTTIVGTTNGDVDGPVAVAKISNPGGLCIDGENNLYFFSGGKIKKLSYTGIVTTIAIDESGTDMCRALDGTLYVTGSITRSIRKIDVNGNATTLLDESSNLDWPTGICIANDGLIYITEGYDDSVKKINPQSGAIAVHASGYNSNYWGLHTPHGITSDFAGNLYIANYNNSDIAKVDAFGNLTQFAGKHAYVEDAIFDHPEDVAYSNNKVYVADTYNHQIKVITY